MLMSSLDTGKINHKIIFGEFHIHSFLMFNFYLISNKVRGLCYSSHTRKLVSISDDGLLGVWDMDAPREEVS